MRAECKLPDFDTLVAFYQADSLGYEQFRIQTLNGAVAAAPARHGPALANTLRQMETARQAAKSPMEAACAAFALMGQSLHQLHDAFDSLQHHSAELQTTMLIQKLQAKARSLAVPLDQCAVAPLAYFTRPVQYLADLSLTHAHRYLAKRSLRFTR